MITMIISTDILEDELKDMAFRDGAIVFIPINPSEVVVANWVRLKCKYGCPSYAKKLSCPPYSPEPEETRKVLDEYSKAYLIGYSGSIFKKYGDVEFGEIFPKDTSLGFNGGSFLEGLENPISRAYAFLLYTAVPRAISALSFGEILYEVCNAAI